MARSDIHARRRARVQELARQAGLDEQAYRHLRRHDVEAEKRWAASILNPDSPASKDRDGPWFDSILNPLNRRRRSP